LYISTIGIAMNEHIEYLDFELEISDRRGLTYPVAVLDSPGGQARSTLHIPFSDADLRIARDPLAVVEAQRLGKTLFDALFTGEIRSRYDVSLLLAEKQDRGLRIRLRILPPELATIPWELLFDSRTDFICLSERRPLVRYIELPQPPRPLLTAIPLRILGIVAAPTDMPPLDVAREQHRLEEATKDLRTLGLVSLEWVGGQSWRDVNLAMRKGPWHIFHFIGHGSFDERTGVGTVLFADATGDSERLDALRLARLIGDHKSLRLVILSTCEGARADASGVFSSIAGNIVRLGIPAVLAMQHSISSEAAQEISQIFYQSLADGLPVDAALTEARRSLSLGYETLEWSIPTLYSRAPDGVLFQMPVRRTSALPSQVPTVPVEQAHPALDPTTPAGRLLALASQPVASLDRPALRRAMRDALSLDDLEMLCADITARLRNAGQSLTVSVGIVGGGGLEITVLNLIQYMDRRGLLQVLLDALRERE
jgi:hypothetical protein